MLTAHFNGNRIVDTTIVSTHRCKCASYRDDPDVPAARVKGNGAMVDNAALVAKLEAAE
jgi:hypothetical protein